MTLLLSTIIFFNSKKIQNYQRKNNKNLDLSFKIINKMFFKKQ